MYYQCLLLSFMAFQLLLVFSLATSFAPAVNCLATPTTTIRHQRSSSLFPGRKDSRGRAATPSSLSSRSLMVRGGSFFKTRGSSSDSETPANMIPAAAATARQQGSSTSSSTPTTTNPLENTSAELVLEIGPSKWKRDPRLGPKQTPPGFFRSTFPDVPWQKVPDWMTYARCCAIPALVYFFYRKEWHVQTSILFAVASFTDWIDGYLARRWDITTSFGAFLDPVADKLMVSTALILLAGRYGKVTAIPAAIILSRELAVSALREWMASHRLRDVVKVGFQGKVKTALTMLTLTLLLLVPESGVGVLGGLLIPSHVLLYVCAAITVTSGSVYFKAAAPNLMKR